MPNKTIYVSTQDVALFDEAKQLAKEGLSSVIAHALREYVTREQKKAKGMQEISVMVGKPHVEREQRFIGTRIAEWQGFSTDKQWWMQASIYQTQKGNWAIHLITVCKASLLTDKKSWKEHGDYLVNPKDAQLLVTTDVTKLQGKIPNDLFTTLMQLVEKTKQPIEYLDI